MRIAEIVLLALTAVGVWIVAAAEIRGIVRGLRGRAPREVKRADIWRSLAGM